MDYSELFRRGKNSLPTVVSEKARFDIPNVKGHLQGNKTVISNFNMICSDLHREPSHILKFLLKELATYGEFKNNLLILNSKLSSKIINQRIRDYANIYLLCYICGKPDTELIQDEGILYLKCNACGQKPRVRF